jgi:bacillithiol biosynthesis cysteine-adding enzyme BshC
VSINPLTSTETAQRAGIDIRQLPGQRSLAADYVFQFDAVARFFAGNPASGDAWAEAIRRTRAFPRRRGELATLLAAQQRRRGAPAAARDAAARRADDQTVAIVTGQQAGLFGGPLYTLLKALTAIRLAERVTQEQGTPAVAVFWVEGEDHDWDEVRSCTVLDGELLPHTIALPPRGDADAAPVATVALPDAIRSTIVDLEAALPPTEFTAALVEQLQQIYQPGTGMADACGRWLETLLGPHGLVVYDASDPAAKPAVCDLFAREIESSGETARLAATAGADLERLGYHAQVQAHEDSPALFHLDGARRAIRREGDDLTAGDERWTGAALADLARREPARFSPNVLLRPLVQDTIFPSICYVAGPNELAYLAQLRGVYERFGVPMPLMFPRATATLLDAGAVRFLNRYDVRLGSLQPQDESVLNHLLATQLPPHVEASIQDATQAVTDRMEAVIAALPAVDPTLAGAARSTLGRMQHDLKNLHGKLIQAAKRRDDTLRRQFTHARRQAYPEGHAQERTVGFVSFLNQYGPALIDRLRESLPLEMGKHWVITI